MIKLIINEWNKIFLRKGNLVTIILIVAISALFSIMPLIFTGEQVAATPTYGDNWQPQVNQQIEDLEKKNEDILSEQTEDSFDGIFTVSMNESEIERLKYHLKQDIKPAGINNFYNNLVGATALNGLLGIFVAILASAMVSKEFNMGTIKLLLIRTQSRTQILTAKLITTILYAIFYYLVLHLATSLFSVFTVPMNPTSDYVFMGMGGIYEHVNFFSYFAGLVGSNLVYLIIIATLAFTLSTATRNTTISLGATLATIFLGPTLAFYLDSKTELAKYLLMANWNLENFLPGNFSPVEGISLTFSATVNAVYVVLMIAIAYYAFNKKDVMA